MDCQHVDRSGLPSLSREHRRGGRSVSRTLFVSALLGLSGLSLPLAASAVDSALVADARTDLTELSLEELLDIDVTSVSLRPEPARHAAAAITVLTAEDLHRAGVQSIAEALRLVPGMNVARRNANTYSISARGFQNGGDKLQVLVDGRSVYTPLTSAVFWDVLDTFIPDIERIEVIRGPGATLWGANAVNGVVNIITRSAADTHGGMLQAGGGSELRGLAALRSGSAVGKVGDARFYAKAFERDDSELANGANARDAQRHVQGGMRSDWRLGANQTLSLSGDLYAGTEKAVGALSRAAIENELNGANLNGRWALRTSERGSLSATLSYDQYRRSLPETFREHRETWDLGLQHQTWIGSRHEWAYGIGYRHSHDSTGGAPLAVIFNPDSRELQTFSAFVQDQIHFGDNLTWTLGTKFEHNDFTGTEIQPGTRLGWQFHRQWFGWGAVSRALRTPNRLDTDVAIYCPPPDGIPGLCGPDVTLNIGNPDLRPEQLLAYEAGLRYLGGRRWSADVSLFFNDYEDLRSTEVVPPPFGQLDNKLSGEGHGGELALNWRPLDTLRLNASYSYLQLDVKVDGDGTDTRGARTASNGSPRHQAGLLANWQFAPAWSLSGFARYVDAIETSSPVPAYSELDLHLSWRPWAPLELRLSGQNLLDAQHPEYGPPASRGELQRAVFAEFIWAWK